MFIEFEVGNYRSFRDKERFSMQATSRRANDNDEGLEETNVFTKAGIRLLKTKAIYGSNASGKSNLAKAFSAFVLMVSQSVKREDLAKRIWDDRFQLLTNWDDQPIYFQFTFLLSDLPFRYGFQILNGNVEFEWLFGMDDGDEIEFFMRRPGGLSIQKEHFAGAETYVDLFLDQDNEIFRQDALFLTGAALNGHKFAAAIRNKIRACAIVDGVNDKTARRAAMHFLEQGSENQIAAFKDFLRATDTGIEDVNLVELSESFREFNAERNSDKEASDSDTPRTVFSVHSVFDEEGNKVDKIAVPFGAWESQGSAKLFAIAPLMLEILRRGDTMIIDEFDARFHPNLTLKIVKLFQSEKTNPHNAQLIFVTHDTGLLRRASLRRDQISLINKDKYGISTIRTLIQYKGVRKDASYEKEYLQGSYSAVPYLDEIDRIIAKNWENQEDELSKTE